MSELKMRQISIDSVGASPDIATIKRVRAVLRELNIESQMIAAQRGEDPSIIAFEATDEAYKQVMDKLYPENRLEEMLLAKVRSSGGQAMQQVDSSKGYTYLVFGERAELGEMQALFKARGIDVVVHQGQDTDGFPNGLRIRTDSVQKFEQLLQGMAEKSEANSLQAIISRKIDLGKPDGIWLIPSERDGRLGQVYMIGGTPQELQRLQELLKQKNIETQLHNGRDNSGFPTGLRVKTDSSQLFADMLSHHLGEGSRSEYGTGTVPKRAEARPS